MGDTDAAPFPNHRQPCVPNHGPEADGGFAKVGAVSRHCVHQYRGRLHLDQGADAWRDTGTSYLQPPV